jgi:hypothetical protein
MREDVDPHSEGMADLASGESGDETEPMTVKRFVVVTATAGYPAAGYGPFYQVVDLMTGRDVLRFGVLLEQAEFYANLFNGKLRECEEGRRG